MNVIISWEWLSSVRFRPVLRRTFMLSARYGARNTRAKEWALSLQVAREQEIWPWSGVAPQCLGKNESLSARRQAFIVPD